MRRRLDLAGGFRSQHGMAMIVLITLIVLVGSYLIASRLSQTSAELSADRELRTMAALREAKAALIAYASDPSLTQIGSLPCPDRKLPSDANAGKEESLCGSDAVRIGRLPWKTINVSSDLRDGSGEQLWYVLSGNFRKLSGTTIINSDTPGQITVTGSAPATAVVALIIAPGAPMQNQNRDETNLAYLNDPSNYLEGANAGANDNVFETRAAPADKDAKGGLVFNDRMLAITHADLFATVEPVVAGKLQNTQGTILGVKDAIEVYRTTWGRYPFAAAFGSGPAASTFQGTAGTAEGLLPVTADPAFITWETSSPAPTVVTVSGTVTPRGCTTYSTATRLECQFDWNGNNATVRITATADNVALAFVRSFIISDLTVDRSTGSTCPSGSPFLCSWTSSSTTINSSTYTLASGTSGTGTITLTLQMPNRTSARTARIRIPVPPYHSITTNSDPGTGWFIKEQWHKSTYYAVAAGYLPNGAGSCAAGSTCLTVNQFPAPNNNKNAILIIMGRSLDGSARPSGTALAKFLEGQNASTGDNVFAHRTGPPGADNDRVVVLSP